MSAAATRAGSSSAGDTIPGPRPDAKFFIGTTHGQRRSGLFPLRRFSLGTTVKDGLTRKQTRRLQTDVDRCLGALNWLHGEQDRPTPVRLPVDQLKCDRLQQLSQHLLIAAMGNYKAFLHQLQCKPDSAVWLTLLLTGINHAKPTLANLSVYLELCYVYAAGTSGLNFESPVSSFTG